MLGRPLTARLVFLFIFFIDHRPDMSLAGCSLSGEPMLLHAQAEKLVGETVLQTLQLYSNNRKLKLLH